MAKVNYHMHTTGSDGGLSPRQLIEEAIKAGIKHICLTDHYPLPKELSKFDGLYPPRTGNDISYYNEVMKLKEEFKDRIDISFGMEFDYFSGLVNYTKKEIAKRDYDFVIGSVHVILKDDEFFITPWAHKDWKEFIEVFGSEENAIRAFYEKVKDLVQSGLFDCVGHLDVIKNSYPDNWKEIEAQDWYKKIILDVLDEIKKSKMCIEINASGWFLPVKEQYPSEWILKEAKRRNIPVTIGNDFHGRTGGILKANERIDSYLEDTINLAKKVGYKSVMIFKKRKPIKVEI